MTTVNMKEFEAKLAERKLEAKAKAEQLLLEARMSLLDDPTYLNTLASIEVTRTKNDTLESLIKGCEHVIAETPIYDKSTRQERKWSGRYTFEFGNDIQLLFRLATGMLYSVAEHKELMYMLTKLSSVTVEAFVSAMGSPAYYSSNYNTVVEATPYNAVLAKAYATVLSDELGLSLDTSSLTEDRFAKYFAKELNKAELLKQEVDLSPDSPFIIS